MSRGRTRSEGGRRKARALALAAGVALLTGSRGAGASPVEDPSEGGAVFTGPTQPHASSIFINPAALGFAADGLHLHVGGDLRLDTIGVDRRSIDPATGDLAGGESVSTTTWSPGGTIAVYGSVLQDQAVLAASLHTTTFQRFPAGHDALGYHVLGGYLYQSMLSLAGCFEPSDWFKFGLGVSIGYAGLKLDFERDTALEAGGGAERGIASDCGGQLCGLENPQATETYRLSTSTGGVGDILARENLAISLGVAFRIERWWTALSVFSPPGAIPARDYALVLNGDAVVRSAPRDGGERHHGLAEITYRMPYMVWAGTRGPILPGYDLVAGVRWENLSRHDLLDVRLYGGDLAAAGVPEWYPRYLGMRDVWLATVGLEGQEVGRTRYGARLHVETGATTARSVSPIAIDGTTVGAAGGVELRLSQRLVLQVGYDLSWFPAVSSTDSDFDPIARVRCVDSDYRFDECGAVRDGRAIPTAAGTYRRLRNTLSLGLRYDSL